MILSSLEYLAVQPQALLENAHFSLPRQVTLPLEEHVHAFLSFPLASSSYQDCKLYFFLS